MSLFMHFVQIPHDYLETTPVLLVKHLQYVNNIMIEDTPVGLGYTWANPTIKILNSVQWYEIGTPTYTMIFGLKMN